MTTLEYLKKYKKLIKENRSYSKEIKIAYLASSTLRCVKETLTVMCDACDIKANLYVSDYNQYAQEILDENSELYSFKPELLILALDFETILGDKYFEIFNMDSIELEKVEARILTDINSLVDSIRNNLNCTIIIHNFEVPIYSPIGILEDKQNFGSFEMIENINYKMRNRFKNINEVYVFDYDKFLSGIGKNNARDFKMYYLGDMKLDMKYIPNLCCEYMGYIRPIKSVIKKCLVLDLDNTLWGGIVGEDGIDGIKLGPTGAGKPFYEFQKYIKMLLKRGIILAVNSKNNYDDAMEVINRHPYMLLREKDFANITVNWNDKASNMKSISKSLNIGLESLVFMDDDKLNCEIVRESLPEVKVVNLPEDPSLYVKTLMDISSVFNVLYLTEEDKKKGIMYAQNRKREEFKKENVNIDDYLKGLNIHVYIKENDKFNVQRIAQLTQKTNQFNLTTKRYFEKDIEYFMDSPNFKVLSISVKDKFGDNGICGVVILEVKEETHIDTFLLSCRVMGRKIENAIMSYIEKRTLELGFKTIYGEYIPTKKNIPVKNFYDDMKFNFIKEENDVKYYIKDCIGEIRTPEFIDVTIGGN